MDRMDINGHLNLPVLKRSNKVTRIAVLALVEGLFLSEYFWLKLTASWKRAGLAEAGISGVWRRHKTGWWKTHLLQSATFDLLWICILQLEQAKWHVDRNERACWCTWQETWWEKATLGSAWAVLEDFLEVSRHHWSNNYPTDSGSSRRVDSWPRKSRLRKGFWQSGMVGFRAEDKMTRISARIGLLLRNLDGHHLRIWLSLWDSGWIWMNCCQWCFFERSHAKALNFVVPTFRQDRLKKGRPQKHWTWCQKSHIIDIMGFGRLSGARVESGKAATFSCDSCPLLGHVGTISRSKWGIGPIGRDISRHLQTAKPWQGAPAASGAWGWQQGPVRKSHIARQVRERQGVK